MLIASEPFGLMRAAQMVLARVELKYGRGVFNTGQWWWEVEDRSRPIFEWTAKTVRDVTGATEPSPDDLPRFCGIEVRFLPAAEIIANRKGLTSPLGRITLNTDRTDLDPDTKLYR